MLTENNHGTGGIASPKDERDFQFTGRGSAPFDWSVGFDIEDIVGPIKTKNQFQSSSCGGQAWSYYNAVLNAICKKITYEEESAKYVYAQTFVQGGGSNGRDNCNICTKQGVSDESLCPSYDANGNCTEAFMIRPYDITAEARADALTQEALSYANPLLNIDAVAQAIRDNSGVVLGVYGQDNGTWLSSFPKPPTQIAGDWAHWLMAGKAKMINGKKYIGVKNSWGPVGDNGWQWLGEEYFNNKYIWEAWTMIFKPIVNGQYRFNVDMKYGDRSEDVKQLQIRLGMPESLHTGYYGKITSNAVLQYQIKNISLSWYERYWLKGTVCGQKTRSALNLGM